MNDHFFVLMYATSGEERNVTRFASYTNVQDVVDMVNDWLTKCCYMDCYLPGEQEETLKAQNGGKLPETAFQCPEVKTPADLEKYNGFYDYESLGMFNAHAHGEGLAGHVRPGLANHLEGVTRGVPAGQHDAIGGEDFRRSRALIDEANGSDARFAIFAANLIHSISDARTISSSALKHKAVEARKEPYLSPRLLDLAQDVRDHAGQDIAAHVGLRIPQDLELGARVDELLEDEAVGRALCARLKLAVRERAGSSDAELDVALGVEDARRVVRTDDLAAAARVVAALHEQRPQARAGKRQRAEKARAPRSDHDDAAVGHAPDRLGEQEGLLGHEPHALLGASPGELAQKGALRILACAQPDARGEGQHNVVLLARVDGAAPALDPRELTLGHAELLCDDAAQRGELAGVGAVELG